MMSYSILAFITGLAIYQGFVWTRDLDPAAGATNNRNIFIAYIVSTGFCQIFFLSVGGMKHIEGWVDFGSILVKPTVSPEEQLREPRRTSGEDQSREPLQMEEYPIPGAIFNAPNSSPTAAERQVSTFASLVAVLEAAARAHEASAEADRRVGCAYRTLHQERNLPSSHQP